MIKCDEGIERREKTLNRILVAMLSHSSFTFACVFGVSADINTHSDCNRKMLSAVEVEWCFLLVCLFFISIWRRAHLSSSKRKRNAVQEMYSKAKETVGATEEEGNVEKRTFFTEECDCVLPLALICKEMEWEKGIAQLINDVSHKFIRSRCIDFLFQCFVFSFICLFFCSPLRLLKVSASTRLPLLLPHLRVLRVVLCVCVWRFFFSSCCSTKCKYFTQIMHSKKSVSHERRKRLEKEI